MIVRKSVSIVSTVVAFTMEIILFLLLLAQFLRDENIIFFDKINDIRILFYDYLSGMGYLINQFVVGYFDYFPLLFLIPISVLAFLGMKSDMQNGFACVVWYVSLISILIVLALGIIQFMIIILVVLFLFALALCAVADND